MDITHNGIRYHTILRQTDATVQTDQSDNLQIRRAHFPPKHSVGRHTQKSIHPLAVDTVTEAWVVLSGTIIVRLYDDQQELLFVTTIHSGDIVITYDGYHELETLEDVTLLEIKNQPFTNIKRIDYAENT